MIASIRGVVSAKHEDSVVIVVGGIGLDIIASRTALEQCTVRR